MKLLRALVIAGSVAGLQRAVEAETITSPTQLSPYHVVIDFEGVVAANPLVIGQATFTSLTGSLVIFDASQWPANGTEISSKTLFPGAEPDSAIAIEFAEPISEVLLGWGDPNFSGNVLRAFDMSGNLLEEAAVELGPPGGGHAAWIGFRRQTADIKKVIVQPDQSLPSGDDYVIDNIHISLSPQALLSTLINDVISLNVRAGIANSFDHKLSAVMAAIDDARQQNQAAAVNGLSAFINAVQAQSGKELTKAQADSLILLAERISTLLGN